MPVNLNTWLSVTINRFCLSSCSEGAKRRLRGVDWPAFAHNTWWQIIYNPTKHQAEHRLYSFVLFLGYQGILQRRVRSLSPQPPCLGSYIGMHGDASERKLNRIVLWEATWRTGRFIPNIKKHQFSVMTLNCNYGSFGISWSFTFERINAMWRWSQRLAVRESQHPTSIVTRKPQSPSLDVVLPQLAEGG